MEEYLGLAEKYGFSWIAVIALAGVCFYLIKRALDKADEREKSLQEEKQEERDKFYTALDESAKAITDSIDMNKKLSESLTKLEIIQEEVHTAHEDIKQVLDIVKQ